MKHSLGYFFMACLMPMLATAVFATPPAKRPPVPVPTVPVPTVLDMGLYAMPIVQEEPQVQSQPVDVYVTVTLKDYQKPNLLLSTHDLTFDKGSSGTVGVSLSAQPDAPVEVTVSIFLEDTDVLLPLSASPNPLTFTQSNWNTAQEVTITAGEYECWDSDDHYATVVFSASGGSYQSISPRIDLLVTHPDEVIADQELLITQSGSDIAGTSITITEGGSQSKRVGLALVAPTENVTVEITTFITGVYAASIKCNPCKFDYLRPPTGTRKQLQLQGAYRG